MSNDKTHRKSFTKSLFAGRIEQSLVFPFTRLRDDKDSLKIILNSLREFAKDNINAVEIDRTKKIPDKILKGLAELGIFGMIIPEEYGGYEFSATAYNRVFEEIAAIDASIAATFGAHQSIGLKALLLHGTEEQKKRFLPKLATGEHLAAFALTEPGAGSDAAGIQTTAVLNTDGKFYTLNGGKIWITNGGIADIFTVFAKTKVNDEEKISAFIVTRDMEGFSSGKEEAKLGIRGSSTTELTFENVQVPVENLVGPLGKGFKVAMEVLNSGRLGLAAGCIGGVKKVSGIAIDYAKKRNQFNLPIAKFEIIQQKISDMAVDAFVGESMVYLTTGLIDRGDVDYSLESAICKIFASDAVWRATSEAMQIAGGIGYSPEYPYERALRDARINLIFEGTNEVLRAFVALAGMQEHGKYLQEVGKALQHPLNRLGVLTDYALHRIKRTVTSEKLENIHPQLESEARRFEEYTKALNLTVEKALVRHKKDIIQKGLILNRIADVAIDLFAMAAAISRVDGLLKTDANKCGRQLTLTRLFCKKAWRRMRRNLRQVDSNSDELCKESAHNVYETNGYTVDFLS